MWQLWVNLGEKNTLIHRYLFHSQIMATFQQKRMQKFKGPSGGNTDGKCCHLVAFYMDCTYTGGLKNASSLAVITFEIAFLPFHSSRLIHHTWRNLLIQSSESVCGFCYQTATFFSDSQKPIAAFGLPHSHPGPHWSAGEHPLSLLPSSGCHWWRPTWGPPADLHSGSRPRRPPGCPGLWTWCRRRQIPGLWCEAACWLDWTAQTVAPRGAACLMRCHYGALTHVPSIQPWHAGGYLIMEERGEEAVVERRGDNEEWRGGKGATAVREGRRGSRGEVRESYIEDSHKEDRKAEVMKPKQRKEKQTGHTH